MFNRRGRPLWLWKKTHWIWQQMIAQEDAKPLAYISPATVGVDAYRLSLNVPQLQVEHDFA